MKFTTLILALLLSTKLFAQTPVSIDANQIQELQSFAITIDPSLAPPWLSQEVGQIKKAICGEVSLDVGDLCILLVKESAFDESIYIVDLDVVEDSHSINQLVGEWIKLDDVASTQLNEDSIRLIQSLMSEGNNDELQDPEFKYECSNSSSIITFLPHFSEVHVKSKYDGTTIYFDGLHFDELVLESNPPIIDITIYDDEEHKIGDFYFRVGETNFTANFDQNVYSNCNEIIVNR